MSGGGSAEDGAAQGSAGALGVEGFGISEEQRGDQHG